MAYARRRSSSRRKAPSRGYRTGRRAAGRSVSRGRSSVRRGGRTRSSGRHQTVRIVLEQVAANPVARPAGEGQVIKPRRAKF